MMSERNRQRTLDSHASDSSGYSGLETWRLALSAALLGTLLLLTAVAVRKWILGEVTVENPQILWMAPVSLLFAMLLPAAGLAIAQRFWPRVFTVHLIVWVFSFMALLNFILHFQRLSKFAILLLAAGVATQLMRWLMRRQAKFASFNRRFVPVGYTVLLFAALTMNAWRVWGEDRAVSQLPPAAPGAPNVVLLILDTVRAASLSLYGYSRPTTPFLDSLANTALVFDRAIAPAPWTLPTHASLMTGLWPHEHGATWHAPLAPNHYTLAQALSKRGYRTGGFVANLTYTSREYGIANGFAKYRDFKLSWDEVLVNSPLTSTILNRPETRRVIRGYEVLGRKLAPDVTREFLDFLDEDPSRPFFAFLNYMDAHDPYLPPPPFDSKFGPVSVRRNDLMRFWGRSGGRLNKEMLPPEQIEGMIAAYDGAIAMLDHEIGRLVASLRDRGVLNNTVLIVTSDHGEFFGEHGLFEHAKAPFLEVIHVPLLIWAPGRVPMGQQEAHAVSLRRVPATVMSIVDGNGESNEFPGESLLADTGYLDSPREPVLSQLDRDQRGTQPDRGENTMAAATMFSVVVGPFQYLRLGPERERLFDYLADPSASVDLTHDPTHAHQLKQMRVTLDSAIGLQLPY